MAGPYILLLAAVTVLVMPYVCRSGGSARREGTTLYLSRPPLGAVLPLLLGWGLYIGFSVFRQIDPGIGSGDAVAYQRNFEVAYAPFSVYMGTMTTFEPGYSLVVWCVRRLTDNYDWMLFLWHSVVFWGAVRFLRKSYIRWWDVLPVALTLTLLLSVMNTQRMAVSIVIALNALPAMGEEKWIRALLLIAAAMSVQVSAVIMLPVWLVVFLCTHQRDYKRSFLVGFVLCGGVMAFVLLWLAEAAIGGTAKGVYLSDEHAVAWGVYLAAAVFSGLALWKYAPLTDLHPLNRTLIFALPVCLVVLPLQYRMPVMYRLNLYFLPILFALLPSLLKVCGESRRPLERAAVALCAYGYMLLRLSAFFTEELPSVGPYVSRLF